MHLYRYTTNNMDYTKHEVDRAWHALNAVQVIFGLPAIFKREADWENWYIRRFSFSCMVIITLGWFASVPSICRSDWAQHPMDIMQQQHPLVFPSVRDIVDNKTQNNF